jgi:hypothetical protein
MGSAAHCRNWGSCRGLIKEQLIVLVGEPVPLAGQMRIHQLPLTPDTGIAGISGRAYGPVNASKGERVAAGTASTCTNLVVGATGFEPVTPRL